MENNHRVICSWCNHYVAWKGYVDHIAEHTAKRFAGPVDQLKLHRISPKSKEGLRIRQECLETEES